MVNILVRLERVSKCEIAEGMWSIACEIIYRIN